MRVRGQRNNNLGNIRKGSSWKGLSPYQQDKEFCTFVSIEYGLRALFVLFRTYHYKYKLNSIEQILYRYAPLKENNTFAYISFVCSYMNKNQNFVLPTHFPCDKNVSVNFTPNFIVNAWNNKQNPSVWLRLFVKAVCKIESNYDVTDEQIEKAINLL